MSFIPIISARAKVGKTDTTTVTVDPAWLAGEVISSATVTAETGEVTIGAVTYSGGNISFVRTGVSPGVVKLCIDYETPSGRQNCASRRLIVEGCDCPPINLNNFMSPDGYLLSDGDLLTDGDLISGD